MHDNEPSRTAWLSALARARHQLLDEGRVFGDAYAVRVLGAETEASLRADPQAGQNAFGRAFRGPLAARSRIAEETLAEAVGSGVAQYVVLGTGLDTFALRNPWHRRLRVFEVDHPATLAWRNRTLQAAGLALPDGVVQVPVDFEQQDFWAALRAGGLDPTAPLVCSWLGVSVYLSAEAFAATVRTIGRQSAPGSVLVFDFVRRPPAWHLPRRAALALLSRRYRAMGEPWRTLLHEDELRRDLSAWGYRSVQILDPAQIARQLFARQKIGWAQRRFGSLFGGVVRAWR
jgi:methyltransferase (TIGR00027 family)